MANKKGSVFSIFDLEVLPMTADWRTGFLYQWVRGLSMLSHVHGHEFLVEVLTEGPERVDACPVLGPSDHGTHEVFEGATGPRLAMPKAKTGL